MRCLELQARWSAKIADALGIEMIIGAIFGAAFFVIGWRQMQPP
jgi:hypothetical protein